MSPIEGANAFQLGGTLHDLGMRKCAHDVFMAGVPVPFHGSTREFVILGNAFVVLGIVDKVHDVAHFIVGLRRKNLGLGMVLKLGGKLLEEVGKRYSQPL